MKKVKVKVKNSWEEEFYIPSMYKWLERMKKLNEIRMAKMLENGAKLLYVK